MGRIIKGQILASTHLDSAGERLTLEQLEGFLTDMPAVSLMNQQHDLSLPPVARGTNPRIEVLPDGQHAIRLDLEVLNEEVFARSGGASISFSTRFYSLSFEEPPEAIISINDSEVTEEQVRALVTSVGPTLRLSARFRREKAAESSGIVILEFISKAIAEAFLGAMAMFAMQKLRSACRDFMQARRATGRDSRLHVTFPVVNSYGEMKVLIEISPEDLCDDSGIDVDNVLQYVNRVVGESDIQRVCVRRDGGDNVWRVVFFVTREGEVVAL